MKRTWLALALGVAVAGGWWGGRAFSEDAPAAPACPPDVEKLLRELGQPGPMHEWLAAQAGEWDVLAKAAGPDGKVDESKATATVRMVLGGRFQEQRFRGTIHGQPFEGFGLTGYDNLKKEFVNYWFDTMGTAPSVARGQRSADGASLTLAGAWEMPGSSMPFQQVTTVKGDQEMRFVLTGTMEGKATTMMEATYTRR